MVYPAPYENREGGEGEGTVKIYLFLKFWSQNLKIGPGDNQNRIQRPRYIPGEFLYKRILKAACGTIFDRFG